MMTQRAVISLNILSLGMLMKKLLEFACSQVLLFINESKIFRIMVFISRAAGNSPSTLSSFRARKSLPVFHFLHIFWRLCIYLFYLCLCSLGRKCPSHKMIEWCWSLFQYIDRETTCFILLCFSLTFYIRLV